MKEQKQALRSYLLAYKKLLSYETCLLRNKKIDHRFRQLQENLPGTYYHVYFPIDKNREPNTLPIITNLLKNGNKIIVSKTNFILHSMTHFHYENDTVLATNKWGIPEPVNARMADTGLIDVVIVPLLAMDRKGNRLGYGKGFYDRFLSSLKPEVKKIGLSFGPPLDCLPFIEPHDVRLDCGITPEETLSFV